LLTSVRDNEKENFILSEQWVLMDRRGFEWNFDFFIKVGHYREVIDVNSPNHGTAKVRSRDIEKASELEYDNSTHKRVELRAVKNWDCSTKRVEETARKIIAELVEKANLNTIGVTQFKGKVGVFWRA
jgi:hypothetical protein